MTGTRKHHALVSSSSLPVSTSSNHPGDPRDHLRRLADLQIRQLSFRQRTLGTHHVDSLDTMEHLAETLVQLGELDRAAELLERSLNIRSETLGERDPSTIGAAWSLFEAARLLGDEPRIRLARDDYLAWLAEADPAELSERLRHIREWVVAAEQ